MIFLVILSLLELFLIYQNMQGLSGSLWSVNHKMGGSKEVIQYLFRIAGCENEYNSRDEAAEGWKEVRCTAEQNMMYFSGFHYIVSFTTYGKHFPNFQMMC